MRSSFPPQARNTLRAQSRRWCVYALLSLFLALFSAFPVLPAAAAVKDLMPGGQKEASAAQSEKTEAELSASLDEVIHTLEDDKERKALVDELKQLRAALPKQEAGTQAAKGPGNLLENISRNVEALVGHFKNQTFPLHFWQQRINSAMDGIAAPYTDASGLPVEGSGAEVGSDFLLVLSVWAVVALGLIECVKRVRLRFGTHDELTPNPTTRAIALYVLRRFGPWLAAFLITLALVHATEASRGKALGLMVAYAVVGGAVFSSLCALLFSLCTEGHRRHAVRCLLAPRPLHHLYAIGVCFALNDAMGNPEVGRLFSADLLALISSLITICAALLILAFTLSFRRPVAHLIANRPFAARRKTSGVTEIRQFLGKLWAPLMAALAVSAVVITLFTPENKDLIVQRTIASLAILIMTLFAGLLLRRSRDTHEAQQAHRRRSSAYVRRFGTAFGRVLLFALWIAFFEFAARVWDYSLIDLMHQKLGRMVFGVIVTAFIAWLLWLIVDTAILEALSPRPRKFGGAVAKAPGARARTLLPLCRGAVGALIGGAAAIIALANLGIDITPFIAGAGVVGLAVGFGAQTLVQDIITGLFIIIEDTISIGDYIETSDHGGTVEGLSIRTVRLRDLYGTLHTIPFSQIKTVKNLSRQFACSVFEIGVDYASDMDKVFRALRAVGSEMMGDSRLRRDLLAPLDVQGIVRFDDSAIVVRAVFKTRPLKQWAISREFNLRLKKKFDQEGIEIPFPQRSLHLAPDAREALARMQAPPGDAAG